MIKNLEQFARAAGGGGARAPYHLLEKLRAGSPATGETVLAANQAAWDETEEGTPAPLLIETDGHGARWTNTSGNEVFLWYGILRFEGDRAFISRAAGSVNHLVTWGPGGVHPKGYPLVTGEQATPEVARALLFLFHADPDARVGTYGQSLSEATSEYSVPTGDCSCRTVAVVPDWDGALALFVASPERLEKAQAAAIA